MRLLDPPIIVAYIVFLALCILFVYKTRIPIVKKYKSELNKFIDVRKNKLGELYMTLNGYTQGIEVKKGLQNTAIDKSYWYFCANSITEFCKNIEKPKVLLLGLGAGTVPHIINNVNPNIEMTVVEYDPVVIQVCKDYFRLNDLTNTHVINADAFEFVKQIPDTLYDAVLIDLFISEAPYLSPQSQSYNFIADVDKLVKKDGWFVLNRPANDAFAKADQKKFMELVKKIFKEYKENEIIDPRNYYNYIIEAKYFQPGIT